MRFLSSRNKRMTLLIFFTLIIVFEIIVYIAISPRPPEEVFQFYLLGQNHMTSGYFPGDTATVQPGERIIWYLGVENNMGSMQFVSVRVKAGNQSTITPTGQFDVSSQAPIVGDFMKFLDDNETWEFPIVWSLLNATTDQGVVRIVSILIDNQTYIVRDWVAAGGYNFRLIFELWTWQPSSGDFGFGWESYGGPQVAWLQVWFNVTSSVTPPPPP